MKLTEIDSQVEVNNFWSYLGPFYNNIPSAQKLIIEQYWKALADGVEALTFNSLEAYFNSNLNDTKGYVEDGSTVLQIDRRNCLLIPIAPPVIEVSQGEVVAGDFYECFITGVQIIDDVEVQTLPSNTVIVAKSGLLSITWETDPGISKYYIYRRDSVNDITIYTSTSNSISDFEILTEITDVETPTKNLTIDKYIFELDKSEYYITIPTLKTKYGNSTLEEGTDYDIINMNELHLNYGIDLYDEYYADAIIKVAPVLRSVYLQVFGEEQYFKKIYENSFYSSYINSTDPLEIKLNNLAHIAKLIHIVILNLLNGCSLKRLEKVINIFYNVPFAYESGEVLGITEESTYYIIDISGIQYKLPNTLVCAFSIGDSINKYDLLCSNIITADDYIWSEDLLSLHTTTDDFYTTVLLVIPLEVSNLNYIKGVSGYNLLDHLKTILLNPGLKFNTIEE